MSNVGDSQVRTAPGSRNYSIVEVTATGQMVKHPGKAVHKEMALNWAQDMIDNDLVQSGSELFVIQTTTEMVMTETLVEKVV